MRRGDHLLNGAMRQQFAIGDISDPVAALCLVHVVGRNQHSQPVGGERVSVNGRRTEGQVLQPGDLIATGTPTGVGMGRGIYLQPGDVMVASIDGIGSIENPLVRG